MQAMRQINGPRPNPFPRAGEGVAGHAASAPSRSRTPDNRPARPGANGGIAARQRQSGRGAGGSGDRIAITAGERGHFFTLGSIKQGIFAPESA
jgi:hypothetical protein